MNYRTTTKNILSRHMIKAKRKEGLAIGNKKYSVSSDPPPKCVDWRKKDDNGTYALTPNPAATM